MADMRFADVMQQERERLHKEREEILNQQRDSKISSSRSIANSLPSMRMKPPEPRRHRLLLGNHVALGLVHRPEKGANEKPCCNSSETTRAP